MKLQYWTLRYVPDVVRGEFVNVGVVVANPMTGEGVVRTVDGASEIPLLAPSIEQRRSLWASLQSLRDRINALGSGDAKLEFENLTLLPGAMSHFVTHMNNMIQVSEPGIIASETIEEAAEFLYKDLVARDVGKDSRTQYRSRVKEELIKTYGGRTRIARNLVHKPQVRSTDRKLPVDLVVFDEHVRELTRGFSFAGRRDTTLENSFDAWNFRLTTLRQQGGMAKIKNAEVKLPRDVPVTVVVDSPQGPKQKELYSLMKSTWHSADVDVVDLSDLGQHADRLEDQLAVA